MKTKDTEMFAVEYGLRVGDTVIVTEAFRVHIKEHTLYQDLIDSMPMGKECEITELYVYSHYDPKRLHWGKILIADGELVIYAKMVQEMRAAWEKLA